MIICSMKLTINSRDRERKSSAAGSACEKPAVRLRAQRLALNKAEREKNQLRTTATLGHLNSVVKLR